MRDNIYEDEDDLMSRFNITGMVLGMLTAFLFISLVTFSITGLGSHYDPTGFDSEDLAAFDGMDNLSITLNDSYQQIDKVTVDRDVFDFFADIYNKVMSPFKFIYRSFETLITMSDDVIEALHLPPFFGAYIAAVLIAVVIIGIVLIRFFMNKGS